MATNLGDAEEASSENMVVRLSSQFFNSLAGRAVIASIILVGLGAIIAPSTVSASAFLSILPFVAVLAVVSIGQHLVIQQRGLDISVAGIMSFAAVIVTKLPSANPGLGELMAWIALALAMGLFFGLINGLFITLLRVPALVTTIGVNAVLFGVALIVSEGVPSGAPPQLASFAINLTLGIPNTIWIAAICAAVAVFVVDRTAAGRGFVGVSVSPGAAFAVGLPVKIYRIGTYTGAGLLYSIGGIMLAGYLSVPNIFAGNEYILATVAAVVVGGNSVAGGARGSIIATIVGAFFLSFLSQLVLSAGLERSMQNVIQALIVICGVGLPMLVKRLRSKEAMVAGNSVQSEKSHIADEDEGFALELANIEKSFGPVRALKGVTFRAWPGQIHAILGENGAGKSTLISIAAGVLKPTSGLVYLDGEDVSAQDAATRRTSGISVAFQHPALAPDLTVYENLLLAAPDLSVEDADKLIGTIATSQLHMEPNTYVGDLTLAQLHVVEIARALSTNPKVMVFDEPTEPFQHDDIRKLFKLINELRKKGVAIVYVSHRLHEITELADRISVMRDGEMVGTGKADQFTTEDIIGLIAGKPLEQIFPHKAQSVGKPLLEVNDLSGVGFNHVSMTAHAGEIIGLAGIEGEGQREFLRALAGVNERTEGQIQVDGQILSSHGPAASRNVGLGFVPDDRHMEGLFLNLSVRENIGIGILDKIGTGGVIRRQEEDRIAKQVSASLAVRTPSIETSVSDLSGGNQQKVLFGREMSASPRVLLIDEPTKGVDIGARSEIYKQLRSSADNGTAIIVAASDGVELEGLCDRVFVFSRGAVSVELAGKDVTDATITEANLTSTAARKVTDMVGTVNSRFRRFLAGDHFPSIVLLVLTAAIVFGTNSANEFFLSGFNINQMLLLLSILAFISMAQFVVIMVGGIDLSVGPLAGLVVVLASFLMPNGTAGPLLAAGGVGIIVFCALFGFLQGTLVTVLKLPAIVVTLASFIGLQGISLILRPRPAGRIDGDLSSTLSMPILGIPFGMWLVIACVLAFEYTLYRRGEGRKLRAVGSNPMASIRLGVDSGHVVRMAFAAGGAMTGMAGLLLAAQIGIGSGTTGVDFSLMSITAVVLGGVAVTGGRGSAISVLFGAALVQATISASSFLSADSSLQYTVVGAITLLGAFLFSVARGRGTNAASH